MNESFGNIEIMMKIELFTSSFMICIPSVFHNSISLRFHWFAHMNENQNNKSNQTKTCLKLYVDVMCSRHLSSSTADEMLCKKKCKQFLTINILCHSVVTLDDMMFLVLHLKPNKSGTYFRL